MTRFRYKAVSGAGDIVEGEIEARTQSGVINQLHDRGFTPIRADEVKAAGAGDLLSRDVFGSGAASRRDIGLLTRELATLLRAGLPLDRSVEILIDLADRQMIKDLLGRVLEAIREGATLAAAMAAHERAFPTYYVSMVQAGEASGALDEVLTRLADYMERAQAARDRVTSALIYPMIVLVMAGLSVVVLLTVVVPEFKPLFEDAGAALPWPTRILVSVGDLTQTYWWAILLGLAIVIFIGRQQLRNPASRRRWDEQVLRIPLFGELARKVEVARFARIVGTLVINGVALLNALAIARHTLKNTALAAAIDDIAESLKQGRGLAEPLVQSNIFPSLALHLIRVGEETGHLEEMLLKVADIYDTEVERSTQRLLALLVPAVTIFLGLLIAAIIGSVFSAMLGVYDIPL
jgi:general secretion pathway protein F